MIIHPGIDPVAFSIGPVSVHWYGLMYLAGFAAGYGLGTVRAARPDTDWETHEVADVLFYIAIGVILGGRLGYAVFYNPGYYFQNPLEVFQLWTGGMSFHGGLLGVIAAMAWYAFKTRRHFFQIADFIAPLTPLGLFAGRIGNFINQELWGKVSDLPWAIVFPASDPSRMPRHPSMLYEAFLEGILLFIILWLYSRKPRSTGHVSGLFLICYGAFRFLVEFVRHPDPHIGYLALDWLTMGQVLSIPMILLGLGIFFLPIRQANRLTGSRKD
ncbi:MAG: Prolipoprotein diacylglyceryl transferase [Gammaproteobacteria bacterium]|nr:Prolipoprotein diacylglyceryl transferase [Gammaproteobacteria bacterium]